MTKVWKWLDRDSVKKWFTGVVITLTVTVLTLCSATFRDINNGSKEGVKARQENKEQDARIERLEESDNVRRMTEIIVVRDVEELKQDVKAVRRQIEKIYEILITK